MEIGHDESNCKRNLVEYITDHFQKWDLLLLPLIVGTYPHNLLKDMSQYVRDSALVPFGFLSIIMARFFYCCIKGTRIEKDHNKTYREQKNEGF
ncbi:hypothetical protein SLA2020_321730 [Shorea laevis]